MNILPNSKWIECKKGKDFAINDPQNPWEGIEYSPRPKGMEKQFQPIENMGGLPMFRRVFNCKKGTRAKITATRELTATWASWAVAVNIPAR